ncbi:TonB family protein [Temperatibacter marinus]|uniref:Protein TonB n=1 Tax=Temperatibacter marinus TaxID=1456591 RepID=A0AA52HAR7_9PROT|nr:TonB family protein [Temperatibacter marinus]WND02888.1 TonB family protein [Temperatibacter marinus]
MRQTTRYTGALVVSGSVTFSLFMLMSGLVAQDDLHLDPIKPPKIPNVIQMDKEVEPKPKGPTTVEPIPPVTVPPTYEPPLTGDQENNIFIPKQPELSPPTSTSDVDYSFVSEGEMTLLASTRPNYPISAQEKGIEGYCEISLTVNADGTVDPTSIRFVDGDPGKVFFKASRKAALKFRYQPRVRQGVALTVENVVYRFWFKLPKE